MAALQLACTSLRAGDCDTAVTGGVNILTNPDIFAGLSRGQFLSKVGPCQTFDNDADGYCRGDAVGTVILKRLEDAEADHDNVIAVILSSATNHSADAISITHPHDKTQEILYKKVLDQARVDPLDVCYVEMHGTGTQAGDGTEMRSVTNVFAPIDRQRQAHQKLYLGSAKANVGHGEAASGITALIKSLLMLRHNAVPPHVGIKRSINKGFPKDLTTRNVHIAFQQAVLQRTTEKRRIFVNNFSAAGGNSAALVEDGCVRQLQGLDTRPVQVVSVSARALSSLKANLRSLVAYLDEHSEVSLPSLSYTTTARRIQHNYRISFAATDIQQLKSSIEKAADTDIEPISSRPRICFTFTGQGSHYAGLGSDLFGTCTQFRTDLADFSRVAVSFGFPNFLPLVDGSTKDVSELSPLLVQVGLTCIQIALCRLWGSWGVKPDVVVGHSLGEYAALYAAGVLSISDAIYLVGERARLLEGKCAAGTHAMLAVKASVPSLADFLKTGKVEVACVNSFMETVLSGTISDIEKAQTAIESRGLKATKLNVPYAFHSSQVEPILEEYERIASAVVFNFPSTPVLSPLLSSAITEGHIDASYLGRHARETVNFVGALAAGHEANLIDKQTVFVEVGPHPVCLSFCKSVIFATISAGASLRRNEPAWTSLAITASLLHNRGAEINWNEYHRDFVDSLGLLELPAYKWSLKNYWIDYVNNWCLTKGDTRVTLANAAPALSTTTVQRVVKEEYSGDKGRLVAESDVSRPDLYAAISGHLVNGAALCPSSIYGDIALTIGEHMHRKLWATEADRSSPGINVRHMEVPKPLIAKAGATQILKVTALASKAKGVVEVTFTTGSVEHARCAIEYGDRSAWLAEWHRTNYLIESRISSLRGQAEDGNLNILLQRMAYKLFAALVQYEDTYRGMQRVILDGKNLEATAEVVCQPIKEGQGFVCAPYWIDSIGHLAGFVMNANDELDSHAQVYVSHGWESMRFAKPIEQGKQYRTYVRMLPVEGKMVAGDVYMFEGDAIVGVVGGLKFQCIPRNVLDTLLPPPGGSLPRLAEAVQEVKATEDVISTTVEKAERQILVRKAGTITSQVLEIIADECGVDLSELAEGNNFSDLGVDSLMQLAISGRMRENLDLEVHSTLFSDYPTVGLLKTWLGTFESTSENNALATHSSSASSQGDSDHEGSTGSSITTLAPSTPPSDEEKEGQFQLSKETIVPQGLGIKMELISDPTPKNMDVKQIPVLPAPKRKSSSVVLQGNPKTAKQYFFLFPDGGGSPTSYTGIPNISPDVCVFGLTSPYMRTPHEYTCGVTGMAEAFIIELRRRQPHGPYMIGVSLPPNSLIAHHY